jgi:calcineurin-like phosphoesterase family protein
MKIVLEQGQNMFFSSDFHINHKNICRGVSEWQREGIDKTRDFATLEEMNSTIIDNINSVVAKNDWLVFTGDFSFGGHKHIPEFRDRILCKNILFILGNHDEHIKKNTNNYQALFTHVMDYCELTVVKKIHPIFGDPIASWNHLSKGWMHLHGHVHFTPDIKVGPGRMLDIGMDGNNYMPYSLNEVVSILKDRPIRSMFEFDHHQI